MQSCFSVGFIAKSMIKNSSQIQQLLALVQAHKCDIGNIIWTGVFHFSVYTRIRSQKQDCIQYF